jgi:cephalosporin-C deacetylase-like acetyl esterase
MYIGGPDREKNYYHRAIIGAVRAVRWLAQLPEVDPKHIGYKGISQGGGFGLILGGLLDGTFQGIYCHIPALCDHLGYKLGRASGWPQFVSNSKFKRHPDCQTFLPYYDAVNFARHIHCPVRFTVGLIDGTCCPSSVYAAFNAIPSTDKQIINQPYVKHGISHEIDVDSLKWIEELVTGKPWK